MDKNPNYQERKGPISIGDNVFVGANSTILYDVNIGNNVIIGAGSLVNKDIPDGTVAAGVPCKVIGKFEDYKGKIINNKRRIISFNKDGTYDVCPLIMRPKRKKSFE